MNFNSAIPFLNKNPNEKKILFWCLLLFLISLISNYIFFNQFDLSLISFYRGTSTSLEEYSAQGYLRLLAGVSQISAFVGLAYYWQSKRKLLKILFLLLSVLSFLLLFLGAVLSSSRALILVAMVGIFVLAKLSNRKVKFIRTLSISLILLSLVSFMTVYRIAEDRNELTLADLKNYANIPLYLIVNQGGIDIIKTEHLINYVTEKSDFRYGEMFSNIILLAIPRSIWQDKPVNVDTQFGMSVYNADVYGSGAVPPGILGEFFWDFSWIGLVLASIVTGMIMGLLDKFLQRYRNSIFIKVLFAGSLIWAGMAILGSGLVSFIIGVMNLLVPLISIFVLSSLSLKTRK
jgi:oligosaccharide repeat unit polymerase